MKIEIDNKLIKAIKKIQKDFPGDYNTKELINLYIEWYIRNLYTNGDNYIDRD